MYGIWWAEHIFICLMSHRGSRAENLAYCSRSFCGSAALPWGGWWGEAVNFLGSCFCSCHRCVQPACCSSQPPPAHRLLSAAWLGRQQTQPEEPCDSWGREENTRYGTAAVCSPISHFFSLCWLVSALVEAARCGERWDGNCGQSQARKKPES